MWTVINIKTRISLLLHHCHENITPSHLCVQGGYQPHPAIHEHFSTKEQILSTPSLQFFSLPQVSHPLKTVLHYSYSHANVHAVSILVSTWSKTSRHTFFPINALSLATHHINTPHFPRPRKYRRLFSEPTYWPRRSRGQYGEEHNQAGIFEAGGN